MLPTATASGSVRGSIEYVRCRFDADQGAGVYIRGNEADGCKVRLEQCEIVRRDKPDSKIAPITIVAPQQLDLDAGNVEIVDCMIRDSLDRQPLALSASPLAGLRNVSGSLTVESPSKKVTYTLDAEQLQAWFPAQGLVARIPRFDFDWRTSQPVVTKATAAKDHEQSFRLRREAALVVWAQAGQPVELAVVMEPVGRHTPKAGVIELTSPGGTAKKLKPKADEKQVLYTFTPQVKRPTSTRTGKAIAVRRCDQFAAPRPMGHPWERLGVSLIRPLGTLYFTVPPNVIAVCRGGCRRRYGRIGQSHDPRRRRQSGW